MFTGSQIMRYVLGNVFNVGVSSNTQFLDKNTFYMTVRLQLKLQRVPLKYCRPINLMHCTVYTWYAGLATINSVDNARLHSVGLEIS